MSCPLVSECWRSTLMSGFSVAQVSASSHGYPMHSNNTHALPAIPEIAASYTSQPQYIHSYPSHHYSQSHSAPLPRITAHDPHSRGTESASPDSQWSSPQLLTPVDPIEPYVSPSVALYWPPIDRHIPSQFPTPQERNLVGSSSHATHPVRYQ